MRKLLSISLVAIIFNSCTNGQTHSSNTNLSAIEFAEKLKGLPSAPILDVRAPGEFSKGHLQNAVNYDWNGDEFEKQIASLDKSKPIFVYCLSGGRSSSASDRMRSLGFKEVYEMEGGIMKWRAANLPETNNNTITSTGLSKLQFDALLNTDKIVLIDFYADWCAPCKKMEPYLDEISKDMAAKVVVIRINTDNNPELCRELNIDAIPALLLYKNKTLAWSNTGFVNKEGVLKQLRSL